MPTFQEMPDERPAWEPAYTIEISSADGRGIRSLTSPLEAEQAVWLRSMLIAKATDLIDRFLAAQNG